MMQQSRKPWTKYQDNALSSIVQEIGLKNWPLVSIMMKQQYEIYTRTGKQCRQRWYNQLNPQVNKQPWSQQQEKLLFQVHKNYKNKWIQISKLFDGRTDNAIKNHFYSTIRRSLRRICKMLGNKNSTSQLRNIKPSILSKIFQYSQLKQDQVTQENQQIVQNSKIITQQLLNFAKTKPSEYGESFNEEKKKNLQFLITKLNQFNDSYSRSNNKYHYKQKTINQCQKIKKPRVIIIKSNHKNLQSMIDQSQQQKISIKSFQSLNQSSKNLQTATKQYIYDWQQFQRRCNIVKQIFQNQNQKIKIIKQLNYDLKNQNTQIRTLYDINIQQENHYEKQYGKKQIIKIKNHQQNYTQQKIKNRGFQPYKSSQ